MTIATMRPADHPVRARPVAGGGPGAAHGCAADMRAVSVDYEIGERPARVTSMNIRLVLPAGIPAERVPGLVAVASHCTVHNSLEHPPEVTIKAETQEDAAA